MPRHTLGPAGSGSSENRLLPATAGGLALAALAYPAVQILRFATKIILASFIDPGAFGEVALAGLVAFMGSHAAALGIDVALVAAPAIGIRVLDSLRKIHHVSGGLVALLVFGAALPLGNLSAYPRLGVFLLALAPRVWLANLAVIPTALLVRERRYRALFIVDVGASFAFGGVTILLAASGMGAWSLVGGWWAEALASVTLSTWLASGWSPASQDALETTSLRETLSLGTRVGGAAVLGYAGERIDSFAVGAWLGRMALGTYEMALHLSQMLVQYAASFSERWFLPLLAGRVGIGSDRRPDWTEILGHAVTLFLPIHVALALLAGPLVGAVLHPDWASVAAPLAALALAAGARSVAVIPLSALKAAGHGGAVFWLAMLETAAVGSALLFALPHGLETVAWALFGARSVTAASAIAAAWQLIGVGGRDLGFGLAKSVGVVLAWAVAFTLVAIPLRGFASEVAQLFIGGFLAATFWFLFRSLLDRERLLTEVAIVRGELRALVRSGRP
jgi:O-antigen/teichoic acid export membrane protein